MRRDETLVAVNKILQNAAKAIAEVYQQSLPSGRVFVSREYERGAYYLVVNYHSAEHDFTLLKLQQYPTYINPKTGQLTYSSPPPPTISHDLT